MRALLAVALVLLALNARGDEPREDIVDGNLLYEELQRAPEAAAAYILGIHDGIGVIQYHAPSDRRLFCAPVGITGEQLAEVVRRSLEADPMLRDYPAAILVIRAFVLAFPCGGT
ncbi:MAG TPA: Rap1a/Tai family immunity protein [Burkholderiales bacterium]|nr:Rap1a/Tai family immunity protein [Burkholderiales bacterium]